MPPLNMEIVDTITAEEFITIQNAVGYGSSPTAQIEKALANSLIVIGIKIDGQVVAMGRLIGDMARNVYVQDLFIMPAYQRQGIGKMILDQLLDYVKTHADRGMEIRVGLMAAYGKEDFYVKQGFRKRPNDHEGCGMQMNLLIE